jgi:N-acetylmuramoyl-L-alanine amidase
MLSSGRAARIATAVAVWLLVSATAAAQTARERYEAAIERDARVRADLAAVVTPPAELLTQATQVMTAFEILVRRFPTSGYADNALFQAASLAEAAYAKSNRQQDRDRATKYYKWLADQYPASSFNKRALARWDALSAVAPPPPSAPVGRVATSPLPPEGSQTDRATLTKIERTVTDNGVRVTIELDREVRYLEQRLTGPNRVFFDLQNVQAINELKDQVLSYTSDVVNKIRVGRHPGNVVRVVLDLEDVQRHSVFALYSPFRLVIDAERTAARTAAMIPPPLAATPINLSSMFGVMPRAGFVAPDRPEIAPEPLPATTSSAVAVPIPSTATAVAPSRTPPPPVPASPSANAAGGFSIARQLGLSVSRIVIDPGHGGHDPGVLGKGLTEAALVLDVSLRLEKLLLKEAGVDVVLTRRTDVYVPLEERTEIANRQNADMFLSIHANASRNEDAKGIETFFLSFASSPDAEAVAARENSASMREMHHLTDLVKAITLNNKIDESRDLANIVQDSLVTHLRKTNRDVRSRGVKKAPFVVLIGAQMPSVLAEISFVSNSKELALLKTPAYRQKIAESLHAAITKYRRSLKNASMTDLPEQ